MLGTIAAALADYVFKVQAVNAFGKGDDAAALLRDLLRRDQPAGLRHPDHVEHARAREARAWPITASTPSLALAVGGVGAHVWRRDSRARSWRAAASRCSGARCSARATSCSSRRFPPPRSARRNQSSTSASIGSAMRSAAPSSALLIFLPAAQQAGTIMVAAVAVLDRGPARRAPAESGVHPYAGAQPDQPRGGARPRRRRGHDDAYGDPPHHRHIAGALTAASRPSNRRRPTSDLLLIGSGDPGDSRAAFPRSRPDSGASFVTTTSSFRAR